MFEGTVHVGDASEIVKLQGSDINPSVADGQNGTYAVLVFDQPVDVAGMGSDGSGQRNESAKMLGIAQYIAYSSNVDEYGNMEMCKSLNGQRVTLAAKAQDIWFPSDVRLPIGEPSAREVIFLS